MSGRGRVLFATLAVAVAVAVVLAGLASVFFRPQNPPASPAETGAPSERPSVSKPAIGAFKRRPLRGSPPPVRPLADFHENERALVHQPVELRTRFAADLAAKSAEELFELWNVAATAKDDALKLEFIADALAIRLRDSTGQSADVLAGMKVRLGDAAGDPVARWNLVQILGKAATQNALALLLELADSTPPSDFRRWVLDQVARSSGATWGQRFHAELSPPLEKSWAAAGPNDDVLTPLGIGLASVGAPDGLKLLFSELERPGRTVSEFEQHADEKAWSALGSLEQVRNPAAVPFLESKLNAGGPESITTAAAGSALAAMGQREATAALLRWVVANDADVGTWVADWFPRMRDEGSVKLADTTVSDAAFVNPANRAAVQAALALWRSQRH